MQGCANNASLLIRMTCYQTWLSDLIGQRKTLSKFDLVLKKHPELYAFVQSIAIEHSCHLDQAIHMVLYGIPVPCRHGTRPSFISFRQGYNRFCGTMKSCICAREDLSDRSSARSADDKARINSKRRTTNQDRYGCENPLQLSSVREQIKLTNQERYGVSNPQQNPGIRDKTKLTTKLKYGADSILATSSSMRADINKALKNTAKDRIKKTKKTIEDRYGVSNPSQIAGVSEKKKSTYRANWNADHFMSSDLGKEIYQSSINSIHGVKNVKQRHLTPFAIEILDSPQFFKILANGRTLKEISDLLGINPTTAGKRVKEYGLEDLVIYHPGISSGHAEISAWLSSLGIPHMNNDRVQISPKELDIWIPSIGLAIEYCGVYWHGEISGNRRRGDHKVKYDLCQSIGIDLITIYEPEWSNQQIAVKNLILNRLKRVEKTFSARMLAVKKVPSTDLLDFYSQHHMQGHVNGYSLVLHRDGDIQAAVTLGHSRFSKDEWELYRFAAKGSIPGGFTRLLTTFCKLQRPSRLISYVNHRFNRGLIYPSCGFRYAGTTIGYQYVDPQGCLHHRQRFQKHKLVERFGADPSLTEWEIMQSLGYDRIWDCGQSKYVLDKPAIDRYT